ncbi:2-oxoglutarate dehydrogenase E1 component [Blochmannia endosymbiont of Polyrhachis (Hedomyrma) turneri]|uniref:2-oxoglutarate dehydrogenase E1 component n=1 Tax=Blochmannia endosymbiont of Polyrhachis (Hedomyrma) turneri TaxID=1505596 RepID=UPI00061A5638|nr:2-oxoglutarate dehydrogenase E1 component [Blochmannia endosymbiont of Polyrhachis (Hedomyrma) turneri]AKC59900.1 2-oxoglutarate dehydrogenase E1 component [Blochmannia endosymbiont of Polyrhachis (Hedomyrma) turneri]
MKNNTIQNWLHSSCLTRENQVYIEELYKKFLKNSKDVDSHWSTLFETLSETNNYSQNHLLTRQEQKQKNNFLNLKHQQTDLYHTQEKVFKLIDAFRLYGYQNTALDPLGMWTAVRPVDCLDLNFYKFSQYDLQKSFHVGSLSVVPKVVKLIDIYTILKKIYCGSIGFEYMHIDNIEEISWIQQNVESIMGEITLTHSEQKQLLNEIIQTNDIEQYLAIQFPGTKRFSLEGADVLVPMLKEIIRYIAVYYHNTKKIILSMAHRGRLNVLINVLNKKPSDLFLEFSDFNKISSRISGDVKYHQGFSSNINMKDTNINVLLLPNPSHLEIVNAVAMGVARAYIDNENVNRFSFNDPTIVLPVTIHGDAAISGQGVVQEILNMSKVPAYNVGGTVRIIINNQIGFTTSKICDIRSSRYCTDIAKMIQVPIFHVNADDPEKVIFVIRTALKFRNTFKRDVLIDLVCYRRHGHNEVDEPSVTQPIMYKKINKHPNVYQIYSDYLKYKGVITDDEILNMTTSYQNFLKNEKSLFEQKMTTVQNNILSQCVMKTTNEDEDNNKYNNIRQQITSDDLKKLALSVSSIPKNFQLHPRVYKIYQSRIDMAKENKLFDWGGVEIVAYATLLNNGTSIRLSGEDTTRGTFFHRHAIVHDQNNGNIYIPLANIRENQGNFSVWDSVLSEEASLAFEYGYSVYSSVNTLVIWEAQFGDFSNGAQIVIDQFISSGEQKWGQKCSLVMLLPHGYEGQGPEHSSARIERYLQLCAENNMKICIPSTPAQIYHLLRYQILHSVHTPLIIMSPKSLLRHPMVNTSIYELTHGKFQKIIGEINNEINPKDVKRILICSGKIYYDLLEHRQQYKQYNVAIIRIEQLYPFPTKEIQKIFDIYTHVKHFVWCQEEPKNQGAWYYIKNYFYKILPNDAVLNYVGRSSSASPAVGYLALHKQQQKILINSALNII